jgi:hypothetical protein
MSDVILCGVLRMPPELWGDDPLQFVRSAMLEAADEIERLTAQNTEAATFLDGLAAKIEDWPAHTELMRRTLDHSAADCRAMAAKLRERK